MAAALARDAALALMAAAHGAHSRGFGAFWKRLLRAWTHPPFALIDAEYATMSAMDAAMTAKHATP